MLKNTDPPALELHPRQLRRRAPATRMIACAAAVAGLHAAVGYAAPLEVYGRLPSLEDVALSPSGSRIAMVHTSGDSRTIVIGSLTERKAIAGVRVGNEKLRSIEWADDDHLLITTSVTTLPFGFLGSDHEWYLLQDYDVKRSRIRPLPERLHDESVRIMNVISGNVMVRRIDGHTVLFIPGMYVSGASLPALFRYDLDTGGERLVREGYLATRGWLVDGSGEIAAEEDYAERGQRWSIKIRRGGILQPAASGEAGIEVPDLMGFGPTSDTLLVQSLENGDPVWRLLSMTDGTFGPPMAERRTLETPIEDPTTHRLVGGVHVEDAHLYVFFDPNTEARWESIVEAFPGERVRYVSSADGFAKVVVLVEGTQHGYRYVLVDLDNHSAFSIGDVYQGVTAPLEVRRITYAASDGMEIPAYLTLPPGRPERNLPLVVLPHGGPAERDTAEFDWWSQALADQGYAILRPNYRGSSLSWRFLAAGFGEWGRKMQTDLSDGVHYLAGEGLIDPKRVCIVGASYGGYAALAGVTLQSGVYRCAVSVAGPADLAHMLKWDNQQRGLGDARAIRYWDRFWGVSGASDPRLDAISPIRHVASVDVPVLLIHGRDDTVVPYSQSEEMFQALQDAKKNVRLVTLKHEDHWLTHSDTRLQMLESTVEFLRANDPPD
ncbi:MAG TPA: alpha/beta fold hydrolase [Steroidobacteraceae bacterium]|nr:alpha/beta fold hydrolase [Steroidobacteraceae bacterium]